MCVVHDGDAEGDDARDENQPRRRVRAGTKEASPGARHAVARYGRPRRGAPPSAPDRRQPGRRRLDRRRGARGRRTGAQAIAFLSDKTDWTSNRIDLMAGDHAALKQVHDDHQVVAWFADVFGGFATMPELSIWDRPRAAIAGVRTALAAADPAAAG